MALSRTQVKFLITAQDKASRVLRRVRSVFSKLGKTLNKVGRGMKGAFGGMFKMLFNLKTALLGFAGVAGLGFAIKQSMSLIDTLGKTSKKLGVTSQELQKLRYAASLAGVGQQTLDMSIQRFVRRVGEAANGTGEAKKALEEMGITLRGSDGRIRSVTSLLGDVANAFSKLKDSADLARLSQKLFDSEGVALLGMLSAGKTSFDAVMQSAEKLGFILKDSTVAGVEAANDALTRMGLAFGGVWHKLVGSLAPAFEKFGDWWSEFGSTFSAVIQPAFDLINYRLEQMAVNLGGAAAAGAEWGETIKTWLMLTTDKLLRFFTELREGGKTGWQMFKDEAVLAFQTVKSFAADIITIIGAIASAIRAAASAWKTFQKIKAATPTPVANAIAARGGVSGMLGFGNDEPTGTRASGGGVMGRRPVLVGERGPEVYTPSTAGRISNPAASTTITNIYTAATAHGITNALARGGDTTARGARTGMNVAKARNAGGYGNLSSARSR